jgi:hypothetical protein
MSRAFVACVVLLALSCAAAEKSASKDPMKCERDPKCAAQNGKTRDCWTQCTDDPACVDRCREMQADGLGHK